jgi:dihydroorotate dehydrogenase (NAD+) catalytic subunit
MHLTDPTLTTRLAGIDLANPVMLAAGTCGYVDEFEDVIDLTMVGGVVTKSITALPRDGNATWRIIETRAGMMNAIGLANVGVEVFEKDYAPKIAAAARRGVTVVGSVAGYSIEDYVRVCAAMERMEGLVAVEMNVSCPNVHGGCEFGADPDLLAELVTAVRGVLMTKKLFIKLSPIANGKVGIVEVAKAAIDPVGRFFGTHRASGGADALCLCNTIPAMAIDVKTRKPRLANKTGGLSGPAVHAVAVKIVHDVYRQVAKDAGVPIIGIGGVLRWEDAAEFVLAGATAVEMGTGLFVDPRSPLKVVKGLAKWVRTQGARNIGELVGKVELG